MQLQSLSIDLLRPAPYNPRITLKPGDSAWNKLERSLQEFELVQPVVWNQRTGHVVSGHQRLAVLKHQGRLEVDCVVVDLPLEKEKALNVTLNNASVSSDWDPGRLLDLVAELQAIPDFDATLTGFDSQQLRDLLLLPEEEPAAPEEPTDAPATVQVILEIPFSDWESAQEHLNELLARSPQIRLHRSQERTGRCSR